MFFWRKPITHATALWILVAIAAVLLIAGAHYAYRQFRVDADRIAVFPQEAPNPNVTQPTLFGKVTAIEDGVLRITSEQPYDRVLIDAETDFSAVGGGPFDRTTLKVGATISATGDDRGDRTLDADAVAVVDNN